VKVTGVDLLRGQHDPLRHSGPPDEFGDGQVLDAVPLGKDPAAVVIALALVGLLVTLVRNPIRGRLSVVVAVALVWALLVLANDVGHPAIKVSFEAGFWLALAFGLAAATACAVLLYATNGWSGVDLRPAGFWRRLAAWLLDAIGIGILCVPVAVLTTSAGEIDELVQSGHPPAPLVAVDDDAVAVLCFTSGTAGAPKAAMLTHRSLRANVDQMAKDAANIAHALGTGAEPQAPSEIVDGVPTDYIKLTSVTKDNLCKFIKEIAPNGWVSTENVFGVDNNPCH